MKRILHTEASSGWGGQEMRILEESKGMRSRGYEIIFLVQKKGKLVDAARKEGFLVHEIIFKRRYALSVILNICQIIRRYKIDIVNTHSSLDAWLGGIAARLMKKAIIRTRHLSTPIKQGLNGRILYGLLTDAIMTTCQEVADILQKQAGLKRCFSIPTGIRPETMVLAPEEILKWKEKWQIKPGEYLIGTLCVMRSWKGIDDFLQAAKFLEHEKNIKWIIIGGGEGEEYFKKLCSELNLTNKVHFTGHLERPFEALAALDVFLLLSTKNEGVSQACLQAAFLRKPLITTAIGGLKEICVPGKTGFLMNTFSPKEVAHAVSYFCKNSQLREEMGKNGQNIVLEKFSFEKMLDDIERVYLLLR